MTSFRTRAAGRPPSTAKTLARTVLMSPVLRLGGLRICIAYDCLYPHTIGGAERWYRNLAERLVQERHEVTYLTLRQWPRGADPCVEGVNVVPVGPRMELYR